MAGTPPPMIPFSSALPPQAYENLINWAGVNMLWMKSRLCPCTGDSGNPQPDCVVCGGKYGVYWEPQQGPFTVLLTFLTYQGRNQDIGLYNQETYGAIYDGFPMLTISPTTSTLWQQAATMDLFVHIDTITKYNTLLRVGQNEIIPTWHQTSLTIAPTGAVVVYNQSNGQLVSGVTYTVSGLTVTLTDPDYQEIGTSYTVEFYSAMIYAAYQHLGGEPHIRPFGGAQAPLPYPKRFKLRELDLFLRQFPLASSTNVVGA